MIKKTLKKNDKLLKEWHVVIPSADIESKIETELLTNVKSQVNIPGYRQGHAPLDVLDKNYGERVFYNVLNKVLQTEIDEILKNEKYEMAISPDVNFKAQPVRGKEVAGIVTFTLKPIVPEIKYSKFSFKTAECALSEEDKRSELNSFAKRMAKDELVADETYAVKNHDVVSIDFLGKIDNVPFDGGKAENYKLEIGSKSFIDTFEEQIIGHKKGDVFDVKVSFPAEYHAANLAGKPAVFTVTVKEIYNKVAPEVNENFAKELGLESLNKLEELLFGNITESLNKQARNVLKKKVLDAIIEKYDFEIPETIIERELTERITQEKEKLAKHVHDENCKHEKHTEFNEKTFRKQQAPLIEKSYRAFYLIDSIARERDIKITQEDIKHVAFQEAMQTGMNVKEVMEQLEKDSNMKNYISFSLKEDRVFDHIYTLISKNVQQLSIAKMRDFIASSKDEK